MMSKILSGALKHSFREISKYLLETFIAERKERELLARSVLFDVANEPDYVPKGYYTVISMELKPLDQKPIYFLKEAYTSGVPV